MAASSGLGGAAGSRSAAARVAARPRTPAAQVVDGAVVGHGGQPGPQPSPVGVEGPGPLPEVEEHLLGDVLGAAGSPVTRTARP